MRREHTAGPARALRIACGVRGAGDALNAGSGRRAAGYGRAALGARGACGRQRLRKRAGSEGQTGLERRRPSSERTRFLIARERELEGASAGSAFPISQPPSSTMPSQYRK